MVVSVLRAMENPELKIIPSHLISKSMDPFSFKIRAQHPQLECPAMVTGFPLLLSSTFTLVMIVNSSMLDTNSTPGRTLVSRVISFPLNLNPGSAIQRKRGMGAADS